MKIVNKEEETSSSAQRFKVAVVQASPVVFDRERTLEKVHVLSGEAAHKGARQNQIAAQLVLLPTKHLRRKRSANDKNYC